MANLISSSTLLASLPLPLPALLAIDGCRRLRSAQHRARLSADLADHLAAGSQSIDVIVHGDQATVDAHRAAIQPDGQAASDAAAACCR